MDMEGPPYLQDLCAGSAEAWARFVEETAGSACAAIRHVFARSGVRFEDRDIEKIALIIYQNLVRQEYRPLRKLNPRHDLKAFVRLLATRTAYDALRARKQATEDLGLKTQSEAALLPVSGPAPEMEGLEPREAMMLRIIYIHGRNYREAASLMGMTLNGVGPTLGKGLGKIRKSSKS